MSNSRICLLLCSYIKHGEFFSGTAGMIRQVLTANRISLRPADASTFNRARQTLIFECESAVMSFAVTLRFARNRLRYGCSVYEIDWIGEK